MNWDAIGAFGEIVGAVAVVVSVIYLAYQVRDNTRATTFAATRDLFDTAHDAMADITSNDVMTEICRNGLKNIHGPVGSSNR